MELDPTEELAEEREALRLLQRFWRRLRWTLLPAPAVALVVHGYLADHHDLSAGWFAGAGLVSLGLLVVAGLLARREPGIDDLEAATRLSVRVHVLDAAALVVLVAALSVRHDGGHDGGLAFAVLLLPITQIAMLRWVQGGVASAVSLSVALVVIDVGGALLRGEPLPVADTGARVGLLIAVGLVLGVLVRQFATYLHALRDARAEARHLALHDPLSDLPNRLLFLDRLEQVCAEQHRESEPFAVLFVDLDGFKAINDTLGHAAGDAVICEVADRLRATLRPGDTAARLGGDEFAVLANRLTPDQDPDGLADRLREVLSCPLQWEDREIDVRASVGWTVSRGVEDPDDVLRRADAAMYEVKRAGTQREAPSATAGPRPAAVAAGRP